METIEVPVKVIPITEEESQRRETMGMEVDVEPFDVMMKVFKPHIVSYYELREEGEVSLFLTNSERPWRIYMNLEQFEELLND